MLSVDFDNKRKLPIFCYIVNNFQHYSDYNLYLLERQVSPKAHWTGKAEHTRQSEGGNWEGILSRAQPGEVHSVSNTTEGSRTSHSIRLITNCEQSVQKFLIFLLVLGSKVKKFMCYKFWAESCSPEKYKHCVVTHSRNTFYHRLHQNAWNWCSFSLSPSPPPPPSLSLSHISLHLNLYSHSLCSMPWTSSFHGRRVSSCYWRVQ